MHAHEVHEHVWIPLPRCIEMVFAQQIVDSLSIVALSIVALLAYHTLRARQTESIESATDP